MDLLEKSWMSSECHGHADGLWSFLQDVPVAVLGAQLLPCSMSCCPGTSSSLLSSQPSAHSLLQEQKAKAALLHNKRRLKISWMDVSRSRLVLVWGLSLGLVLEPVWCAIPTQAWDIFPSIWEALNMIFQAHIFTQIPCTPSKAAFL